MRTRSVCFCLTWFLTVFLSSLSHGQEKASIRVSDQIYDVPGVIVFVQSADSHESHIQNALDDFFNLEFGWDSWKISLPELVDRSKPIIYYGFGGLTPEAIQMSLTDANDVAELAKDPKAVSKDVPFALIDKIACDGPIFGGKESCHGIIRGRHLVAVKNRWLEPGKLDASPFEMLAGAKLLSETLDPRMRDFIDRASFGGFFRPDEDAMDAMDFHSFASPLSWWKPEFSDGEKELLKKVEAGFESLNGNAAGVTYEKRQLNLELHLKFAKTDLFDDVLNFDGRKEFRFEPTIGLPSENLLFSFSAETNIFASSESMRLMAKSLFPTLGLFGRVDGDLALFHVTGGLIGDSWKDIRGARAALYGLKPEQFSVIAIFDAREPDQFFDELEKLVAIVEPDAPEGLSAEALKEIESLIVDLGARKYSVRERAETRLSLAGRRAAPSLKTAFAESESAELRMRAKRLLNRLDSRPSSAKRKLGNLNFWANIDPDFAIETGTDSLYEMPARIVRIQLPPDLTEEQHRGATKKLTQLFGAEWDRVAMVRVANRFVAMFGSDEEGLKATVDNLKNGKDPLKRVAVENAPYFKPGSLQVHASFERIKDSFIDERDSLVETYAAKHPKADHLTSLSLSLDPDYWQATFNIPVEEVGPCIGCRSFFDDTRF